MRALAIDQTSFPGQVTEQTGDFAFQLGKRALSRSDLIADVGQAGARIAKLVAEAAGVPFRLGDEGTDVRFDEYYPVGGEYAYSFADSVRRGPEPHRQVAVARQLRPDWIGSCVDLPP